MTCKKESPIYWAEIAISMNGKAAALVDRGGYIWGGSSDFKVCACALCVTCIRVWDIPANVYLYNLSNSFPSATRPIKY